MPKFIASAAIVLACLLTVSCTKYSKFDRGKEAYEKGDFKKAIPLLEEAYKLDGNNNMALSYLMLAKAGYYTDIAARGLKENDFEKVIIYATRALETDTKNQDARFLLDKGIQGLEDYINNVLIPKKDWSEIEKVCRLIMEYQPDNRTAIVTRGRAIFEKEYRAFNVKTIMALNKAYALHPDDKFLKRQIRALDSRTRDFKRLFLDYQRSLRKRDYWLWRRLIHPQYYRDVKEIVKRFAESGAEITTVRAYFKEIAKDPAKYGSPKGPRIICIEPVSAGKGFVHFDYKKSLKVLKMEISTASGLLKIRQEQDSEIKKAEL
jgi:tetratricopeptide (TPR) repeat protein